jgi:vacuolar-type H+-ATPase subunit F/Vma7
LLERDSQNTAIFIELIEEMCKRVQKNVRNICMKIVLNVPTLAENVLNYVKKMIMLKATYRLAI